MKQLFWLVLWISPCLAKGQQSPTGIQWVQGLNWDEVKTKARQENKYIFIDAYATWCGPCKVMDKKVYPDKNVGDIVNEKFIPIKLQMDRTEKDEAEVKVWYSIAQSFNEQYHIEGYPSFLFFSPEGKFVYKQLGMKTVDEFISILKEALTDPEARYQKNIEAFKKRQLKTSEMPDLAREALRRKEKENAISIAKTYKENYIDKLNPEGAFTQANLSFIADFSYYIMKSSDRYFQFFHNHAGDVDSTINRVDQGKIQNVAANVVSNIIRKEEIVDKIYINKKPIISPAPSWDKIKNSISKKYGRQYVDKFFPNEQIAFYESAKDWSMYARYVNEKIKKIPPKKNGKAFGPLISDAWQLNWYSWTIFENCNDKKILEKALGWINLSVELQEMPYSVDTKANLLYKIGKVKDAISIEERAVLIANYDKADMEKTLEKMKQGLPTWPEN